MASNRRNRPSGDKNPPAKANRPARIDEDLVEKLEERQFPPKLLEALKSGDVDLTAETLLHMRMASYAGPLPPAEEMLGYSRASPCAPDRILTAFEKEQKHRHELDSKDMESMIRLRWRGQLFSLIIVLSSFLTAGVTAYLGHAVVGGAIAGLTVIGISVVGLIKFSGDSSD